MSNKPSNDKNKLVLVDGNGLAYRSFYAVPFTKFAMGLPSNAILGFANLLLTIILTEKPTYIVVAFDHAAFTERLLKRQSFNVQREDMPDELAVQLQIAEDFVRACGLKSFRLPGFEADDCIGTLAQKASQDGLQTVIVSGDLELLQLVGPGVRVLTTRRGIADSVIYDEEMVRKKYNLYPNQLADLRALAGDSSQNIGGVPGIGEVTARRLLSQFSSLEELFDSLDQLPAKWRNPLSENRAEAMEYKSRATIRRDLPLQISWDECHFKGLPVELIKRALGKVDACEDFEYLFQRMASLACEEPPASLPLEPMSPAEARVALEQCQQESGALALLWLMNEGTDMGVAFVPENRPIFYLSIGEGEDCLSTKEIREALVPIFADASRPKYVYRFGEVQLHYHLPTANVLDVGVAYELIEPGAWEHSLEVISARYGSVMYDHLIMFGLGEVPFAQVPIENKVCWTTQGARVIAELGPKMTSLLQEYNLLKLYKEVGLPLSLIMSDMNEQGVSFTSDAVERFNEFLEAYMQGLREAVYAEANKPFDLDNDKELGEFLFEQLCLLVPTRPKNGGVISTDVLASLVGQHPLANTVRTYRELSDFKRIFVQQFLHERRSNMEITGYLFNPALAAERYLQWLGKISVSGTGVLINQMMSVTRNLLCSAVRSPLNKLVLQTLTAFGSDRSLLVVRYSSPAYRVLAKLAQDERLAADLEAGICGREFAAILFAVPESAVTKAMVDRTERIILLGLGERWVARLFEVSEEDALARISAIEKKFCELYPISWAYANSNVATAKDMQPLFTVAGRRQVLYSVSSRNHDISESAERWARSLAVCGSLTDVWRKSMVHIVQDLSESCGQIKVINIFGSILVDVDSAHAEECARRIPDIAAQCSYGFELPVEVDIGKSWFDCYIAAGYELEPMAKEQIEIVARAEDKCSEVE